MVKCVCILTENETDTDASENTTNSRACCRYWIGGKLQSRRYTAEEIKICIEMKTVLELRSAQMDV